MDLRYYFHPNIYNDPLVDSLLKIGFSNGVGNYIIGVSTIVHELTHYSK